MFLWQKSFLPYLYRNCNLKGQQILLIHCIMSAVMELCINIIRIGKHDTAGKLAHLQVKYTMKRLSFIEKYLGHLRSSTASQVPRNLPAFNLAHSGTKTPLCHQSSQKMLWLPNDCHCQSFLATLGNKFLATSDEKCFYQPINNLPSSSFPSDFNCFFFCYCCFS